MTGLGFAETYTAHVEGAADAHGRTLLPARPHQALWTEMLAAGPAQGRGPLKRMPGAAFEGLLERPFAFAQPADHSHAHFYRQAGRVT